jgi:adenine-specific DNA-methyltransferase
VREKLRVSDEYSRHYLNHFERMLMRLTRHELASHAEFLSDSSFRLKVCAFDLSVCPAQAGGNIPLGLYELPRRSGEAHLYRLGHPLAQRILEQAKSRQLPPAEVVFDLSEHEGKVSILEPFAGQDEIDRRREQLIAEIESKLQQRVSQKMLFSIRWSLT